MDSTSPWDPLRALRRRSSAVLRWLAMVLVIAGLLPGAHELLEVVEHVLHDGHLPHSAAHAAVAAEEDHPDDACGDGCGEHGCTPTQHLCPCCPSLAAAMAPQWPPLPVAPGAPRSVTEAIFCRDERLRTRATSPPVPPPIG